MQVVEPRLEQAAEVVPVPLLLRAAVLYALQQGAAEVVPVPLLWRGARQGGVVKPRRERRPRNPVV